MHELQSLGDAWQNWVDVTERERTAKAETHSGVITRAAAARNKLVKKDTRCSKNPGKMPNLSNTAQVIHALPDEVRPTFSDQNAALAHYSPLQDTPDTTSSSSSPSVTNRHYFDPADRR